MEVYVDLNNVSKLLPAVLDRVTEINRLDDFQGLSKSITSYKGECPERKFLFLILCNLIWTSAFKCYPEL